MRRYLVAFSICLSMSLCLLLVGLRTSQICLGLTEYVLPGAIPSPILVWNVRSGDPGVQTESLSILSGRHDYRWVTDAAPLLASHQKRVWLNAAYYLAGCDDPRSIPYLIKSIQSADLWLDRRIAELERLTGVRHGADFDAWRTWWQSAHPTESFEWNHYLEKILRQDKLLPAPDEFGK